MTYIKKMCILRQIKQGFSGDGKTLSGLVRIEQYGKNLSIEVSIINFAPLSSGEYYCLISDHNNQTEMLPLRGKSIFNIVSEFNAEQGFCAVICFVKNNIIPVAYGINGNVTYNKEEIFKKLQKKEEIKKDSVATTSTIQKNEMYNDNELANSNYFNKEKNEDESKQHDEHNTYVHDQSRNKEQATTSSPHIEENDDVKDICHPFKSDPEGYYFAVKGEIDELFKNNPKDGRLTNTFPNSKWVKIEDDTGKYMYSVGVIYQNLEAKYICYAIPAKDSNNPPDELKNICTFVPVSPFEGAEGFFVIFQSCTNGECQKLYDI